MSTSITPGDLVKARGREWIALPSLENGLLWLRPLSGSESDCQLLCPDLEPGGVQPAKFSLPTLTSKTTQDGARLFSDSLRLSLRRGAGPFRSTARLSFEPKPYQLVPLLLALRLPVTRLLIADDVGIGKTIEAGLILRELKDRGEIERFSVLCPPHLVEQWTQELREKFDIDATAITASTANRLEKGLLDSQSLFEVYPHTVVSLDYIKAEKHRDNFSRTCPDFVIVDEAHTCVGTHKGKQQRFELLSALSEKADRHLVLLTATPHSGDEEAFERLLGLLDPALIPTNFESESYRKRLAKHFVQRRRIDVTSQEWGDNKSFATHQTAEASYSLNATHQKFHDAVLDYCLGVVEVAGETSVNRHKAFWGTLALMRCVGSSPKSALNALKNRLKNGTNSIYDQIFDEDSDEIHVSDVEPETGFQDSEALKQLIKQAEAIQTEPDPKLERIIKELKPLLRKGCSPVIFCRYIATADYVAEGLREAFPKLTIERVTGELTSEERRNRIEELSERDDTQRLLVATDCLSEGINLQGLFDTVVHYDLCWNPTRHQQREGRVDRFGQVKPEVYSLLLYSSDSAIDGAVLEVILRKAEAIKKATGVTVPLPEEQGAVTGALMNAVLLRKGRTDQLKLDLVKETKALDAQWKNAEEGEKRSRARYAHNAIKPDEVMPEWDKWRAVLGSPQEMERFVHRAMGRFNTPLETKSPQGTYAAYLDKLPLALKERLEGRDLTGTLNVTFEPDRVPLNTELMTRNHPLPSILAESLLEAAMEPESEANQLTRMARVGAWKTQGVTEVTTVVLLRLRYKLHVKTVKPKLLLVEESEAVAFPASGEAYKLLGDDARNLLELEASSNLADIAKDRLLNQALAKVQAALAGPIADFANQRAEALELDHNRVRATGVNVPKVTIEVVMPADVMGCFVLIPEGV